MRSSITRAKVMGTILSISGALVVVLYKGPTIIPAPSKSPSLSLHFPLGSSKANWIIGGLLLAAEYLLASICYIVQVLSKEMLGCLSVGASDTWQTNEIKTLGET